MILAEMDAASTPLSVLIDKANVLVDKAESDPSSAFIDYNGWIINDFNIDNDTVLSPCKTMSSPSDRPQVLQWTPHEGSVGTTVSVIIEQPTLETPHGALKLAFGQMVLETNYSIHSVPTTGSDDDNDQTTNHPPSTATTAWVTITAEVPDCQLAQMNEENQVSVSVYFYDQHDPDIVIDSWHIGTFTYLGTMQTQGKRSLTPVSSDGHLQKKAYTAGSTDGDGQFLHLLQPYHAPIIQEKSFPSSISVTSQHDRDTALWITQQLEQQQQTWKPPTQRPFHSQTHFVDQLTNPCLVDPMKKSWTRSDDCESNLDQGTAYRHYSKSSVTTNEQAYCSADTPIFNSFIGNHRYANQQARLNHCMDANHMIEKSRVASDVHNTTNLTVGDSACRYSSQDSNINDSLTTIHPFAGILNKANLKICGDLMQMTFRWSASEWQCGRRLVRFWRRQNTNNTENNQQVECGFEPIEYYVHQQQQQQQQQQQRIQMVGAQSSSSSSTSSSLVSPVTPVDGRFAKVTTEPSTTNSTTTTTSSLVVSCIYWRERNDYFITSVDCIYLLEGLIGVQFTVEEKNRIRRNLEGFRPLTVSKCKVDCADFFKLIMGFPHPKPRNIEKDVKVFAWKTLPHALRKIIRKYTPNYTNPTATTSSFPSLPSSSSCTMITQQYPNVSPVSPSTLCLPGYQCRQQLPPQLIHSHQRQHDQHDQHDQRDLHTQHTQHSQHTQQLHYQRQYFY